MEINKKEAQVAKKERQGKLIIDKSKRSQKGNINI